MTHLIYHETQQAALCAKHCLNNILQGKYFSEVDLSKMALQLDREEAKISSTALHSFQSNNVDDSGNFSLQVVTSCLQTFNLDCISWNHEDLSDTRKAPTLEKAFICHRENHFLSLRSFGGYWFDLDSLKPKPSAITDSYLELFLTTLIQKGYLVFVVKGKFPSCPADKSPEFWNKKPKYIAPDSQAIFKSGKGRKLTSSTPPVTPVTPITSSSTSNLTQSNSTTSKNPKSSKDPIFEFKLDTQLSTTSVALKLPTGKRCKITLNPTVHTIGDLRKYVDSHFPQPKPYCFQLLRPPTKLEEESLSIENAQLARQLIQVLLL